MSDWRPDARPVPAEIDAAATELEQRLSKGAHEVPVTDLLPQGIIDWLDAFRRDKDRWVEEA